jgi:hypothetical protein
MNFVLALFLGWPAILLTLVIATTGLMRRDFRYLVAAALLSFPFSLALSGFPALSFSGFLQQFPSVMVVCLRLFHGARQGDACMAHGDPGLPCDFTAMVCRPGGRRRMTNLVVFSRLSGGNPAETSAVVSNCRLFSGNRTPLSLQNGPVLVSL